MFFYAALRQAQGRERSRTVGTFLFVQTKNPRHPAKRNRGYFLFRRRSAASPARPLPSRSSVAGSGMGSVQGGLSWPERGLEGGAPQVSMVAAARKVGHL